MNRLNPNGLPPPGRELDAWMAEHVMGWTGLILKGKRYYCSVHGWIPEFSTSAAFFQVMEATAQDYDAGWSFNEFVEGLACYLHHSDGPVLGSANANWDDYPDRLHAYAHAVCCCVWKAKGGK